MEFGEGIDESDIQFEKIVNDLVVYNSETNDSVTISNWYNEYHSSEIKFESGTAWKLENVEGQLQITEQSNSTLDNNASRLIEIMAAEKDQSRMMEDVMFESTTSIQQSSLDEMWIIANKSSL